MRRSALVIIIAVIMLLCLTGIGAWRIATPPVDMLIVPEASQVHVVAPLRGQQTISYQAADATWRAVLDDHLREYGWRGPDPTNPYAPANYYRSHRIWFVSFNEMIAVRGSSTRAEINRFIHITILGRRIS